MVVKARSPLSAAVRRASARLCAQLLLKDGAEVWLLGRDAEKGTEAAVTLSAYGKVHYVQGDVKDLEACRSAAQNVREQRENIDLIVNAAGIYQERRLEKVTEYDFFRSWTLMSKERFF